MAKLSEKIGYAMGDAASGGITWKIMSIVFPFFFTNVFGLTLADAAILMLVARMFDVVIDPFIGSLSDRVQTRFGTYRPFLIYGAIPMGIVFALLLYTPEGLGMTGKRIYAYTFYLLAMTLYSVVNVPYGSMLGVMTDDDNEKNQFSAYRMVGAYAMGFITLLSFPYVQQWIVGREPNPPYTIEELQHQYAMIGLIFGALYTVMTLACGFLTKERLKPVRAEKYSMSQFTDLLKNKPWVYLTLIGICTNFFNGFRYAVAAYVFDYCLDGDVTVGSFIINYTVFMAFGEVVCMIFGGVSPWFTKKVGSKRVAFICAAIFCTVFSVAFFFIPMSPSSIWIMIAIVVITSIGVGIYSPLLWSMYADVADYATLKNGTSSTGLIFSSGTMAQKFGTAVSGSLVALFLGIAGATMITDAMGNSIIDPASVDEGVKTMVWALFSLFPAALALIMAALLYFYPLTTQKMEEVHSELRSK